MDEYDFEAHLEEQQIKWGENKWENEGVSWVKIQTMSGTFFTVNFCDSSVISEAGLSESSIIFRDLGVAIVRL